MAHIKRRVLFLCNGNSCRSQIAEAIVNTQLSEDWQAFSAGVQPTGFIHPFSLRVLTEIGISHEGRSKSVDEFRNQSFDVVITLCDEAAESCPLWLGRGKRIHMGFPDPAKATGSDGEIIAVFRKIRDDITKQVLEFLRSYLQQ
jgi:arsenate reductase